MTDKWQSGSGEMKTRDYYPKERKNVLVVIQQDSETLPPATVVGYLRYAAGQKDSPYFVCPGVGGRWKVLGWSDCLPSHAIHIELF